MHAAKKGKWRDIFLSSEKLSQYECRHFLSVQNMGLTQIHTCIFVSEKDKYQVPPVWHPALLYSSITASNSFNFHSQTFYQETKCKIESLVPFSSVSQQGKWEWAIENSVVLEVKLLVFTKRDEKFSFLRNFPVFSVICNHLWICCLHEIHKRKNKTAFISLFCKM